MPDEVGSDEEHAQRYYGDDLDTIDPIEARVELRRIEMALMTSHRNQHVVEREWLLERHARLEAHLKPGDRVQTAIVVTPAPRRRVVT